MTEQNSLTLILGNQFFSNFYHSSPCLMIEDLGIASQYQYHPLRIMHQFIAMREFKDELEDSGIEVHYFELEESQKINFYERILKTLCSLKIHHLKTAMIPDCSFRNHFIEFCNQNKIKITFLSSPQFLTGPEDFKNYLSRHPKPFMRTFYESMRRNKKILLSSDGSPKGGRFSFDTENRKKLPKDILIPNLPKTASSVHFKIIYHLVKKHFSNHPGSLPDAQAENLWLPTQRKDALKFLDDFLKKRLSSFGPFEDAMDPKHDFVFHSALSPLINLGLITPLEVIHQALQFADQKSVPIQSLEGFIRQILGWREFVYGVHQEFSLKQEQTNFFNHQRKMKPCWYQGTTGLLPLDDAIKKAIRLGYNHHIERLMIISNAMLLSELHPKQVHRWFMEMYVDSYEWVMGPNVYGMGQFSDGGIFATKPYFSGSNYILKMSAYSKGDWCEIWDGLYWKFIADHPKFFSKNPRLSMMSKLLEKMDKRKKERIFALAENFKNQTTLKA